MYLGSKGIGLLMLAKKRQNRFQRANKTSEATKTKEVQWRKYDRGNSSNKTWVFTSTTPQQCASTEAWRLIDGTGFSHFGKGANQPFGGVTYGIPMSFPGLKIGQACQDVIRVGPTIYDCKDGLNNAAQLR